MLRVQHLCDRVQKLRRAHRLQQQFEVCEGGLRVAEGVGGQDNGRGAASADFLCYLQPCTVRQRHVRQQEVVVVAFQKRARRLHRGGGINLIPFGKQDVL